MRSERGGYLFIGVTIIAVILISAAGCLQTADISNTSRLNATPPPVLPDADQGPIRVSYAPGEITRLSDEATRTAKASLDAIAALPGEERTFNSTFLRFDETMTDYMDTTRPLILMGYTSPDPGIAAEGMACEESSKAFTSIAYTRRDLYNVMKDQIPRNSDEARLFSVIIRKFEKSGLFLPEDRLQSVRELKTELVRLETTYMENLNGDNSSIEFSPDELSGIPPEVLSTFKKTGQGTYLVAMKTPDFNAVMTYADRSETRMRMQWAFDNRQADENTRLLEQALLLRQRIAHELGYTSWADYQLDGRMAGSTENVNRFLDGLTEPLQEKSRNETSTLLAIKQSLDPGADSVDSWDIAYLLEIRNQQLHAVSEEEFRQYFPMDGVLSKMFGMYGPMFGITFTEVKDAPVWAPGVRLYRITNTTDGSTAGYLYLDLYPREGKYGHFTEFPIVAGRMKNGSFNVPVTAILGNFPAPEGQRPSLLSLSDLETLFHETGHTMHLLLTRAPYGTLSSGNVEMDFYETAPQTLSEWVFDPGVLQSLSGHYTNRSEKIPVNLSLRAIAASNEGIGILYTRQVALTKIDMAFHTMDGPVNATRVTDRIYLETTGMPLVPGNHFAARFEHLMGGYDAGYYGYLWSMVYAEDIVGKFKQDGMTNVTTGMNFRDEVLAPGNMEDGRVLMKQFLGREPNAHAFYERLGIAPSLS